MNKSIPPVINLEEKKDIISFSKTLRIKDFDLNTKILLVIKANKTLIIHAKIFAII